MGKDKEESKVQSNTGEKKCEQSNFSQMKFSFQKCRKKFQTKHKIMNSLQGVSAVK